MHDIIIIGAGPAGMTAALYAARSGKTVLMLEGETPGGQIVVSRRIENYPALPDTDGFTFSENLKSQALAHGATLVSAKATGIEKTDGGFCVSADGDSYACRAVILATGQKHRKLGVPGEEKLIGRGVSFCATCDGMFFRRREVAVVGGGNTAVQDALVLSEYCSKVYLIHRRDAFRAEHALVDRVLARDNVEFVADSVIDAIDGESNVTGISVRNVKTNEVRTIPVAGVFEAIGQLPQNDAFSGLVELDGDGYLLTDAAGATSVRGMFGAGDVCKKTVRQLTTAVADGTVAALSAAAYVDSL